MKIHVSEKLLPILRLGVLTIDEIQLPKDGGDSLWVEIAKICAEIREEYGDKTVGQIEDVHETRSLYRAVGLDPTKTRPSSEALLRRTIKGKDLYRIHPLVDIFNLVSLVNQFSVGLYDISKIEGDQVTVQLGEEGWGFEGIRRGRINVAGRLCVTDSRGPFGSPTADSERTSIEGAIEGALAVFFQPRTGDPTRLERTLSHAGELCSKHLHAHTTSLETPCW